VTDNSVGVITRAGSIVCRRRRQFFSAPNFIKSIRCASAKDWHIGYTPILMSGEQHIELEGAHHVSAALKPNYFFS